MTPVTRLDHACYCLAWAGVRNACAVLAGRPPLWHPLWDALGATTNRPGPAPRKGPILGRWGAAVRELGLWWHRGPSLCPHREPWRLRLHGVGHQPATPLAWLSKLEHLASCRLWGPARRAGLRALAWGDNPPGTCPRCGYRVPDHGWPSTPFMLDCDHPLHEGPCQHQVREWSWTSPRRRPRIPESARHV